MQRSQNGNSLGWAICDNGIQHIWIKISTILPDDRAWFWMDLSLGKVCLIVQGGEDAGELNYTLLG